MKIVLASASPRRKELLGVMGLGEFEIMTAPGEEQDFEGLPPQGCLIQCADSVNGTTAPHTPSYICAVHNLGNIHSGPVV